MWSCVHLLPLSFRCWRSKTLLGNRLISHLCTRPGHMNSCCKLWVFSIILSRLRRMLNGSAGKEATIGCNSSSRCGRPVNSHGWNCQFSRFALLPFIEMKDARAKCHFDQLNNGSDRRSSPTDNGPAADNMTFHTEAQFSQKIYSILLSRILSYLRRQQESLCIPTHKRMNSVHPSQSCSVFW